MHNIITSEKLQRYFEISKQALEKAKSADKPRKHEAELAIDMAQRYYDDACHFRDKGDHTLAFAALNYAHGWLDCAASLKLFLVNDSRLFTVEE